MVVHIMFSEDGGKSWGVICELGARLMPFTFYNIPWRSVESHSADEGTEVH